MDGEVRGKKVQLWRPAADAVIEAAFTASCALILWIVIHH